MSLTDDLAFFDLRNLPRLVLEPLGRITADDLFDLYQLYKSIALDITISNYDTAAGLNIFLNRQTFGRPLPPAAIIAGNIYPARVSYDAILTQQIRITSAVTGDWLIEGFVLHPSIIGKIQGAQKISKLLV